MSEEASSAPAVTAEGGNGSTSGEWVTIAAAAHTLGVSKRAVRQWCEASRVTAKKTNAGAWEVKLDSLPRGGRKQLPGPLQASRNLPTTADLISSLRQIEGKALDLAFQVGYWKSQAEQVQRLLPESTTAAEKYRTDLERIRRRDSRLVVELVTLAVVAVTAVLV